MHSRGFSEIKAPCHHRVAVDHHDLIVRDGNQTTVVKGKSAVHSPDLTKNVSPPVDVRYAHAGLVDLVGPEAAYKAAREKLGYSHQEAMEYLMLEPQVIEKIRASEAPEDMKGPKGLH